MYYAYDGDDLRNTAGRLGDGIDSRGWGGYVLSPPSIVNGRRYRWASSNRIAPLPPTLRELLQKPKWEPEQHRQASPITHPSRYVEIVLTSESVRVAQAQPGARNHALNRAAFSLGTLVGATWAALPRATVENALLKAARACGLGERESTATIRSGLDSGISRPRPQPQAV